jgi:PadR family transcriptional regulator PadR
LDDETLLTLLDQWESTYKKGLLSFWLLFLLDERPMYVFEMGQALVAASRGTISADGKSLYRALRRFEGIGLVASTWQASGVGPRRRYYHLTDMGTELLRRFVQRNLSIFQQPDVARRLAALASAEFTRPLQAKDNTRRH